MPLSLDFTRVNVAMIKTIGFPEARASRGFEIGELEIS